MDLWPRLRIYGLFSKNDTARQKMENAPPVSRVWGEKTNKQVFFDAAFVLHLSMYLSSTPSRIVLFRTEQDPLHVLAPGRCIGNINIRPTESQPSRTRQLFHRSQQDRWKRRRRKLLAGGRDSQQIRYWARWWCRSSAWNGIVYAPIILHVSYQSRRRSFSSPPCPKS